MSLEITPSNPIEERKIRRQKKQKEVYDKKRAELLNKKNIIKSNKNIKVFFDSMFLILKKLGFYQTPNKFQRDDREVGKLLGISGEMVKRYRIKDGYFPPKHIQLKLIELEKMSKHQIEIIKDTRNK